METPDLDQPAGNPYPARVPPPRMWLALSRVFEVCAAPIDELGRGARGGRLLRVRGQGGRQVWVSLNTRIERAGVRAVRSLRLADVHRTVVDPKHREAVACPIRNLT